MIRRRARIDASQTAIVAELRRIGATVQSIATVGNGCPDLVVGWAGANYLIECKSERARAKKTGKIMRADEQHENWQDTWRGQVATVYTPHEALQAIGVLRR